MPASLTRTALSAAVSTASDRFVNVVSATGLVVGYGMYVDREYMVITSIVGTLIGVRRGAYGTKATPHLIGVTVFVGPPNYFAATDRYAAGTYANEIVQPFINVLTGQAFSVLGGKWVVGNIYGGSTNYGLSPAIWDDCPQAKLRDDFGFGVIAGDDFIGEGGNSFTTAHNYVLTGANGTLTAVATPHGAALLSAPGTDNDESNIIAGGGAMQVKGDAASTWWFESRVKISQITTAQGVFVGLASECGADFMTDNTMALKVVHAIGFQIIAATDIAAIWQSVIQKTSGARVAVNATLLTAGTAYVKLGMKSVAGSVTFYVDGTPNATGVLSSATNFPLDALMAFCAATKCGSAAANTLTVDWWKLAQTRLAN